MSSEVIPCLQTEETRNKVDEIASGLKDSFNREYAGELDEKVRQGLFQAAIEKLRGSQAATPGEKTKFVSLILDHLTTVGKVSEWEFAGGQDRHDYSVHLPNNKTVIIEAKGCLDGNNTNIFQRPPQADEFYVWSLCQNIGSDPRHNVWSGIHTRLGAEMIHRRVKIEGLIVWDMLCGTLGRPCPKCAANPSKLHEVAEKKVTSPCLYLFPRTIPDARSNPNPQPPPLSELSFFQILFDAFKCDETDINDVSIEVKSTDGKVKRKTTVRRADRIVAESRWTALKRANS